LKIACGSIEVDRHTQASDHSIISHTRPPGLTSISKAKYRRSVLGVPTQQFSRQSRIETAVLTEQFQWL
jgi:hypothetical protein